jgi:hypothetical protein
MKKKKHGRESEMEAARQQAINSHQNQKRWFGEPTCVAIARPDCTDHRLPYGTTSQQHVLISLSSEDCNDGQSASRNESLEIFCQGAKH